MILVRAAGDLVAVHTGDVTIQHEQVHAVHRERFECGVAVGDEVDCKALPSQVGPHGGAQDGMIFYHEYAHGAQCRQGDVASL
ncbi:hypothetical protein GCM10009805_25590 [Leucobacter chromiireducens subsp. solipictus]